VSNDGSQRWDGVLPARVGEYFYKSPWVLCAGTRKDAPQVELSAFSADHFKSSQQMVSALQDLEDTANWSLFSWGGYAKYGMIGLLAPTAIDIGVKPIFQYGSAADFGRTFKGSLGRRTDKKLAPALWRALNAEREIPLIVTFAHYEDAFTWDDVELSYSVEGTFAGVDDAEGPASAYRPRDYATFAYFVGLMNQVSFFDILPGSLSIDACQNVRRMAHSFDFSGALKLSPWYLIYNGGEIDTYHVLFVASDHSATLHFAHEASESLSLVTHF